MYTDIEIYPDTSDDEADLRLRKSFHHHTTATISCSGTKTATSAVAGPSSPEKAHGPSFAIRGFNEHEKETDTNLLDQFDFMQDGHFEAWDAEYESAPKQRARTGGVRVLLIYVGRTKLKHTQDNPMKEWLEEDRSIFLTEFLRLDGRSQYSNLLCACAGSMPAEYRCTDCVLGCLVCQTCMLMSHEGIPLHRIEVCAHLNHQGKVLIQFIAMEWFLF